MPFKDPDKRRIASRLSMRKKRMRELEASGDVRAELLMKVARKIGQTKSETGSA
jgi:hypothetical protein